jgi:meso-butanediol dehydrogenase / (S,S)-butanediol dehydrogenase / diacetyl reductase
VTGILAGRRAVVTGAASGIGRATAALFAEEGARVVLVDRDRDAAGQVAARLAGDDHRIVAMDVTDEGAWDALARSLDADCAILVNNAGAATLYPLAETSLAQWRSAMAVNLDSVFLGTRALLPALARSGHGAIVNVSSIRGIIGGVNATAYCASKGAVRLLTKAVALECAESGNGVRVNSVHPGLIDTPLAAAALSDAEVAARRMATLPMGRAGRADEIASTILFAASDAARYMTGAEIVVDGGTIAH